MKLPAIFGRNASVRERPAGLRNLRRSSRMHRSNFRKQLRTFNCFSTGEKLSHCDSEEKQKRKRGLLSQKLRLTESSENQSSTLDVMSKLVMRPSTCPPQGRGFPIVTEVEISGDMQKLYAQQDSVRKPGSVSGNLQSARNNPSSSIISGPSSLTLSSLNEDQLSSYLKMIFQRCKEENAGHDQASFGADEMIANDGVPETKGESALEGEQHCNDLHKETLNTSEPCTRKQESDKQRTAEGVMLREKCFDLIRRHEDMFGPIITSTDSTDTMKSADNLSSQLLHQTSAESQCEPCMPSETSNTYLNIPQDKIMASENTGDFEEWRQYFSSGPSGVWRIVKPDRQTTDSVASAVCNATKKRPRGMFSTLRNKCSSLFQTESKEGENTFKVNENNIFAPAGIYTKLSDTPESTMRVISETKGECAVGDMKDSEIELCTSHQHIMPTFKAECNDPYSYQDSSFDHWTRQFFTAALDVQDELPEPCSTYPYSNPEFEIPCDDPVSYKDQVYDDWKCFFRKVGKVKFSLKKSAVVTEKSTDTNRDIPRHLKGSFARRLLARDWLPVSCWWGCSPLMEVMLRTLPTTLSGQQARLAVLLELLSPISWQQQCADLQRLLTNLSKADRGPAERQVAWLTQPELPRLFTNAGFGPAEMTRWLLDVPEEEEDDQVMTRQIPVDYPVSDFGKSTNESVDTKNRSSDGKMNLGPAADLTECVASLGEEDDQREKILQQTDTSSIETPYTQFMAGWAPGSAATVADKGEYSVNLQNVIDSRLNVHAREFRPVCSDPCMFVTSNFSEKERALTAERISSESNTAYDTYETKQWWIANDMGEELSSSPKSVATPYSSSPVADPIQDYDSETELGENLSRILKENKPAVFSADSSLHIRNSSVRPIDSEVDIIQVLHEQSGYVSFGETQHPPVNTAYQSLPLQEVDSETEIGLALPLTDSPRVLDQRSHRRVKVYDSEEEMASLIKSLHGTDSETEMGRRLEKLGKCLQEESQEVTQDPVFDAKECDSEIGMGGSDYPTQFPDRKDAVGSSSMSRLPAGPVQVDSETEMGMVLNMFEQGMLTSRYFAGVELAEDHGAELTRLASSDSDINIAIPGSHEDDEVHIVTKKYRSRQSRRTGTPSLTEGESHPIQPSVSSEPSLDKMYDTSKRLSKAIIKKALMLLEDAAARYPVSRTQSSTFGTTGGLEGIEREIDVVQAPTTSRSVDGACSPDKTIPEVSITTSDGSFVVLFPSQPAEKADYYETEERLLVKMMHSSPPTESTEPQTMVTESRGFHPTSEAGLSLSEQEVGRRLMAGRCAEAALRRQRSPSPRQHTSDESGLRVLYRAESTEPWNPISPEGLSGLALAPADPELAAVRWRKNSRSEDGDPEPCFGGEGEVPPPPAPPNESQSHTELSKAKPTTPTPMGANSWC